MLLGFLSAYLLRDCRLEEEEDEDGIPVPVEAAAAPDVGLPRGGGAADLLKVEKKCQKHDSVILNIWCTG